MTQRFRYLVMALVALFMTATAISQTTNIREVHRVKKKETIFGIARQYGLTVQELINANPEMNKPGYELKKDTYIIIPFAAPTQQPAAPVTQPQQQQQQTAPVSILPEQVATARDNTIRMGVMLPLHNINGDGRRMVEYYRGVLMACDSLRKLGYSIDVHAWNTPDNQDISPVLRDKAARQCDFIIGPLYSRQMAQLSDFITQYDIRLVIPFSINAPQLMTNRNIFQVYQSPNNFNELVIEQFMRQFQGYNPVIIDCNDSTSTKGTFTFPLRRQLEAQGIEYGITNLKSSEGNFAKSFSRVKPNVVILNTGRAPELNVAMAKLNGLTNTYRDIRITLFGYTDWLMYTSQQLVNFYKYNTYIPTSFYYNPLGSRTIQIEQKYRWNFHQDMMQSMPRFALTGFDHAMFFIQGFRQYGKNFIGAPGTTGYDPVQTPLKFERIGNGGLRNRCLQFIHYLPEQRIESISF